MNDAQISKIPDDFVITYYADKHKKIITRRGTWIKPNGEDFTTTGKVYISAKGQICFIYWDKDAEPNERGSQWRCAKSPMSIKCNSILKC